MSFHLKGVILLLVGAAMTLAFACSITVESGEVHGLHREVESSNAAPTPTPTPIDQSRLFHGLSLSSSFKRSRQYFSQPL
jgi:hypothetical protein